MSGFHVIGMGRMGQIRKKISEDLGYTFLSGYDPELGLNDFPDIKHGDYVFICTPPKFHDRLIAKTLSSEAKRIFVEKPNFNMNPRIFVGWSHRYHDDVMRLADHSSYDYLELTWTRYAGIPGGWFCRDSNVWADLGYHLVDMASIITHRPFKGTMQSFDFSKGDVEYKANWWGGDDFDYRGYDNAAAIGWCGDVPVFIRVSWAGFGDEFSIQYIRNGKLFYKTINPMDSSIFIKETEDFYSGDIQTKYLPSINYKGSI